MAQRTAANNADAATLLIASGLLLRKGSGLSASLRLRLFIGRPETFRPVLVGFRLLGLSVALRLAFRHRILLLSSGLELGDISTEPHIEAMNGPIIHDRNAEGPRLHQPSIELG